MMLSADAQREEFDVMEMGASALLELAMGGIFTPMPKDAKSSAVAITPLENPKPSCPASASAPRQSRSTVLPKNPPKLTGTADDAADIGDVHVVLPRRKAGELDAPEREAVVVTPEILTSLFHHPLAVASQKLGLSATTIKKLCRKLGINKWPYKSPFRTPRGASAAPAGAKASGSSKRPSASVESNDNTDEDDNSASESRNTPSPSSSSSSTSSPSGPREHEGEERMHITSLLSDVSHVGAVQPVAKRAKIVA